MTSKSKLPSGVEAMGTPAESGYPMMKTPCQVKETGQDQMHGRNGRGTFYFYCFDKKVDKLFYSESLKRSTDQRKETFQEQNCYTRMTHCTFLTAKSLIVTLSASTLVKVDLN